MAYLLSSKTTSATKRTTSPTQAPLVLDRETRKFKEITWADVVVGDIVKVGNRGLVPADMLVLAVSEVARCGICYVETKSLDGETNMKVRSAMECTLATMGSVDNLVAMKGVIRCEHPNNAINSFQGVLELEGRKRRRFRTKASSFVVALSATLTGCMVWFSIPAKIRRL